MTIIPLSLSLCSPSSARCPLPQQQRLLSVSEPSFPLNLLKWERFSHRIRDGSDTGLSFASTTFLQQVTVRTSSHPHHHHHKGQNNEHSHPGNTQSPFRYFLVIINPHPSQL